MERLQRACAYCRVSTLLDKQETSLASQIQYYNGLFDKNPAIVNAGIYIDQGISGRTISRRREFQRMLRDCREGRIDIVYCKSITRFGRNTLDTLQSIELLRKLGIPVIFEVEDINTLTDKDFKTVLMSYLAQDEVDKDIEYDNARVKRSFEKGQLIMRLNSLLGYDWDTETKSLKINEYEANAVRQIYDLYSQGIPTKEIARRLNDQGYVTVLNRPFDSTSILRIIHQEKYTGNMMLGKHYTDKYGLTKINHGQRRKYFVENSHPAIISQELWDKCQQVCSSKRLVYDNKLKEYDPFRLKVVCGVCGKNFKRLQCNKITNENTRVSYRCGKCVVRGPKACINHEAVRIGTLKKGFVASFNKLRDYEVNLKQFATNNEIDNITQELEKLLKQEKIYIQMNVNGLLTYSLKKDYVALVDKIMVLQEKKKEMCKRSLEITELNDNIKIAEVILKKYDRLNKFEDDAFVGLVDRVIVHSREEIEYVLKIKISITVKLIHYTSIEDEIAEVIVNVGKEC